MLRSLLLILLASCASPSAAPTSALSERWDEASRPVDLVYPENLRAECQDALYEAIRFWEDQGVDYLRVFPVLPSHPAVNGLPRYREIGLTEGLLSPGTAGQTGREYNRYGLVSAEITISLCTAGTTAHEIGHALGLDDVWDNETIGVRLMAWAQLNGKAGWELSEDELEWVQ